jgi:hypothetical protein
LVVEEAPNAFETHVACFYLEMQVCRAEHIPHEKRLQAYRSRAKALGFSSEADATRTFVAEMGPSDVRSYGATLFKRLGEQRDWSFQFGALFGRDRELITRIETLFLPWLFNSWADVLTYSALPAMAQDEQQATPRANGRTWESPASIEARLLAAMDRGLTPWAAAKECRVAALFGKHLAFRIQHPIVATRPSYAAIDRALIAKVISLSREGMDCRDVAEAVDLSWAETSVIRRVYFREIGAAERTARMAGRLVAAKERLERIVAEGGVTTPAEVKQLATSDYRRVLAEDSAWLESLLSSANLYAGQRRTLDLDTADDSLLELLRDLSGRWLANPPAFQKSMSKIRHELGQKGRMLRHLERYPKSAAYLESMLETTVEANARRLMEILKELPADASIYAIARRSGVQWRRVKEVVGNRTKT